MGEHRDERGEIVDLLGRVDSVTRITTVAGAVRGNHVHHETTQWTLVISGLLLTSEATASGSTLRFLKPGEMAEHSPGVAHAWRAITDADCLVFTRGPRAGEDYEKDTERLQEPLLQ